MSADSPIVLFYGLEDFQPVYASAEASGADLKAHIEKPLSVPAGGRVMVDTGLKLALPPGWEGQVRPRSGLAWKKGLTVLNASGTIDSDYRGEVQVLLVNLGNEPVVIERGDRIAQLVVTPAPQALFRHSPKLDDTDRGAGGFGSTGR